MEIVDHKDAETTWNNQIKNLPGAHALQTYQWGQVKANYGWQPHPLLWHNPDGGVTAAALVLHRTISIGGFGRHLSVMYAPRGPLLNWTDTGLFTQVLNDLENFARQKGAIFIKIDPDLPVGYGIPGSDNAKDNPTGSQVETILTHRMWRFSDEQIQFRNTVMIDLDDSEDNLLMRMKSKTRYNIRLAKRRGVTVRTGDQADIDLLYQMYAHTAVRDEFIIRGQNYYREVWNTFFNAGLAEPLIAEVQGQPVGAVVIFRFGQRAWYMHGMSLDEHREKMFNHRLQWEAIRRAKSAGFQEYDMWGAPDTFNKNDPMWGVYRFKEGFGGQLVRTLGAWDYPIRPLVYRLYSQVLPRILSIMRGRGKSATKRRLSA